MRKRWLRLGVSALICALLLAGAAAALRRGRPLSARASTAAFRTSEGVSLFVLPQGPSLPALEALRAKLWSVDIVAPREGMPLWCRLDLRRGGTLLTSAEVRFRSDWGRFHNVGAVMVPVREEGQPPRVQLALYGISRGDRSGAVTSAKPGPVEDAFHGAVVALPKPVLGKGDRLYLQGGLLGPAAASRAPAPEDCDVSLTLTVSSRRAQGPQ